MSPSLLTAVLMVTVPSPPAAQPRTSVAEDSNTALRPCGETLLAPRMDLASIRHQTLVAAALRPQPAPDQEILWLFVVQPSFEPEWSVAGVRNTAGGGDTVELRVADPMLLADHRDYIVKGEGPLPEVKLTFKSRRAPAELTSGIQKAAFLAAQRARYKLDDGGVLDGVEYHFFAQGRGVKTVCSTSTSPKASTDAAAMSDLAAAIRGAFTANGEPGKSEEALKARIEAALAALTANK